MACAIASAVTAMAQACKMSNLPARAISRSQRLAPSRPQQTATRKLSTYGYSYLARRPHEKKPPLPYQPGTTLRAQAYAPPPPDFYYKWAYGSLAQDIQDVHPLQLCWRNPPAEGTPGSDFVQLRIQRQIRVQDLANSQVAQVEVLKLQQQDQVTTSVPLYPSKVAAKFYDPLYYDFDEARPDPFANCDAAFAHATAAFAHLQPLYGTAIPRFYGSYSVQVPLPDDTPQSRPVRAILYEYVPGIALEDIDVQEYSTPQRKAIMSAVLDSRSLMWQLDVAHGDFHPRNIIVVSANRGEKADIRLIDFDMARCGQRAKQGHVPTTELEPRSEIIKRWLDEDMRDSMIDFAWLVDWPWNEWLENEYARNMV